MPRRASQALIWSTLSLAAALGQVGCSTRVAPPEPPMAVRRGDEAFGRDDYEAAINEYRRYSEATEQGAYIPRTLYKQALSAYRLGRYTNALAALDELDRRYPDEHWVQVDALRGDTQRDLGKPAKALEAWEAAWSESRDVDKPKLKNRIRSVIPDLTDEELTAANREAEDDEIAELLRAEITRRNPDIVFDSDGRVKPTPKVVAAGEKATPPPARSLFEELQNRAAALTTSDPVATPAAVASPEATVPVVAAPPSPTVKVAAKPTVKAVAKVATAVPVASVPPTPVATPTAVPTTNPADLYPEDTLIGAFQRALVGGGGPAPSPTAPAKAPAAAPAKAAPAPARAAAEPVRDAATLKRAEEWTGSEGSARPVAPAPVAPAAPAAPPAPNPVDRLKKLDAGDEFPMDLGPESRAPVSHRDARA